MLLFLLIIEYSRNQSIVLFDNNYKINVCEVSVFHSILLEPTSNATKILSNLITLKLV